MCCFYLNRNFHILFSTEAWANFYVNPSNTWPITLIKFLTQLIRRTAQRWTFSFNQIEAPQNLVFYYLTETFLVFAFQICLCFESRLRFGARVKMKRRTECLIRRQWRGTQTWASSFLEYIKVHQLFHSFGRFLFVIRTRNSLLS